MEKQILRLLDFWGDREDQIGEKIILKIGSTKYFQCLKNYQIQRD